MTVGFRRHEQSNTNWNTLVQDAVAAGKVEARPLIWDRGFADPEGAVRIAPDSASRVQSDFSKTTWKFGTSYDLNDDVMVYASYSEGFNSGGISTIADSLGINQIPFTPETIENTEFGVRGDFLDGTLRVNATYFMTDWVDIQAAFSTVDRATGDPITEVFTANASDGEARGLELELTYFVNDRLQVGANLGFLDTKYVNLKPGAQLTEDTEFGGAPDETYAVMLITTGICLMARSVRAFLETTSVISGVPAFQTSVRMYMVVEVHQQVISGAGMPVRYISPIMPTGE